MLLLVSGGCRFLRVLCTICVERTGHLFLPDGFFLPHDHRLDFLHLKLVTWYVRIQSINQTRSSTAYRESDKALSHPDMALDPRGVGRNSTSNQSISIAITFQIIFQIPTFPEKIRNGREATTSR